MGRGRKRGKIERKGNEREKMKEKRERKEKKKGKFFRCPFKVVFSPEKVLRHFLERTVFSFFFLSLSFFYFSLFQTKYVEMRGKEESEKIRVILNSKRNLSGFYISQH